MPTPSREELTQKLADLKTQSRTFDMYRACMRSTSGEQANGAYQGMLEAEKQYLALSDWFVEQGLHVFWDLQRQEYIVVPSIHAQ